MITFDNIHPYIRHVGCGVGIYQKEKKCACDYRMILILSGDGSICINDETIIAKERQIYIIKPGVPYQVLSSSNRKISVINFDWTYSQAYMIPERVVSIKKDQFVESDIIECLDWSAVLGEGDYVVFPFSANTQIYLDQLLKTFDQVNIEKNLMRFYLTSQFMHLLADVLAEKQVGDQIPIKAKNIYEYIVNNSEKHITLETVAKHFNYCTSSISKLLRKHYNISFKQLLIELRLNKGYWLLENTDYNFEEIAKQTGYCNGQHFVTAFCKKYGKKPTRHLVF